MTRQLRKLGKAVWMTTLLLLAGPSRADELKERAVLKGHTSSVWCVAYSPDGKLVATGSQDKTIKLWDVATGKETGSWDAHDRAVGALRFSDDSQSLISSDMQKTVKLWDVATGKGRTVIDEDNYSPPFILGQSGRSFLAVGRGAEGIRFWDLSKKTTQPALTWSAPFARRAAFSPGGRMLGALVQEPSGQANGAEVARVRLWELATLRERLVIDYPGQLDALAFAPDGRTLAVGGGPKGEYGAPRSVNLFELATGQERAVLKGHRTGVEALAFSPDARLLASGGADGVLKLWDLASGRELGSPGWRVDGLTSLHFSPDGKTLAVGSYLGWVRLYDVAPER